MAKPIMQYTRAEFAEATDRTPQQYTIKRLGDNYALYYGGQYLEVFATRKTAEKQKRWAEYMQRNRGEAL